MFVIRRPASRALPLALCLAAGLLAAQTARSAPGHDTAAPAAPARRMAGAVAAAADPMDALREKLAAKLGAVKAPDAPSRNVVRVTSRSGEAAPAEAPAKAAGSEAHAAPKPSRPPVAAAGLVARLRAERAAAGKGAAGHADHWSYAGDGGPEQWAQLKPDFAQCGSGSRQSPIDIRGGVRVDLDPIRFDYRATNFRVVDNGHTVQVNLGGGNSIEVQGRRYDLVQFHFHRPSEERIDGRQFDMVAHLVHKDPEGRLAVVAVLLDRGSAHPLVQAVWNNLPLEKGMEMLAQTEMDVSQLLPADRRYYTYMGSLTTPPCTEGVLWMVMRQPMPISVEQVGVFGRLYPMNARPLQQASGRLIKQSN